MVVILIVLGAGYYFLRLVSVPKNPIGNVPCSNEYWEAINKADVTICASVKNLESEDNYCRDNCIKEIAYQKGESELCELINPDADYNLAKYNAPEVLVPIKDFCYMHLVEKLGNISLCDNIESEWAKTNCPIQ